MLTDIDLLATEFICYNMRESDKREIFAMRPHDNPYLLAWEAYHMVLNNGRGRIAWHNGKPAVFCAFTETWPRRWNCWMFGTEDFRAAAMPAIRWFRNEAREILTVCEAHRLDCDSIEGHAEAHKMIKALGGVEDGPPMRRYGKNGETFQRFVWFNGENNVLEPGYVRAA